MASKFVPLEEAAQQLGIAPDKLVEMRANNEIHGYRDGGSWKFKAEEVERVAGELGGGGATDSADDGLDDILGGELDLSGPDAGGSSILVNDYPASNPSSTIIGKSGGADLEADSDLRLIPDGGSDEGGIVPGSSGSGLDTLPGATDQASSALFSGDSDKEGLADSGELISDDDLGLVESEDSGDLDLALEGADALGSADDLLGTVETGSDDLKLSSDGPETGSGTDELNLAAAGTGDLSSDDLELRVDKGSGTGDLGSDELGLSDGSGSDDFALGGGSGTGELELSIGSGTGELEQISGSDDLELVGDELALDDDDDDLVLGGSDLSLSGDSGINLGSPTDSGLSLEEEPLEVASSASALELPEDDDEIIALDDELGADEATQLKQDEEFLLSPVDELGGDDFDESDSGSQVIALEDSEAFDADAATMVQSAEPALLTEDPGAAGGFGAEAQPGVAPGMEAPGMEAPGMEQQPAGAVMVPAEPAQAPYSIWNVLGLIICFMMLSVTGVIMIDIVTNIWLYGEGSMSTSLTDGIISMFNMDA